MAMKILHVVGARPNFMKIAPIVEAIESYNHRCGISGGRIEQVIVHTGQHYDEQMSRLFFDDLGIPKPAFNLEVGSASHAQQTAEIMKRFEVVCLTEQPTHVLVVGDVNSTIACALVASKLGIKVVHVEAGLRSFDRSMPEEINRVLTDAISDLLFTTEESANENLRREGVPPEKIRFVGNVMIDTLMKHREKADRFNTCFKLGLVGSSPNVPGDLSPVSTDGVVPYGVLTLHRPSNVDDKETFQEILDALSTISEEFPIIFPVHPRTFQRIKECGLSNHFNWSLYDSAASSDGSPIGVRRGIPKGICLVQALGYLEFLQLMAHARLVLTDSGGIQEETTILGVACLTLRQNTERPVTVTMGTNLVVGTNREDIVQAARGQLQKHKCARDGGNSSRQMSMPPLWDGKAAGRIVNALREEMEVFCETT